MALLKKKGSGRKVKAPEAGETSLATPPPAPARDLVPSPDGPSRPGRPPKPPAPGPPPAMPQVDLSGLPRLVARDVMADSHHGLGEKFDPRKRYELAKWRSVPSKVQGGWTPVALVDEESTPEIDYVLLERP